MPSHLISPPAVERKVPVSKPLGTAPVHVSVSATHADLAKKAATAPQPVGHSLTHLSVSATHADLAKKTPAPQPKTH